MTVTISAADADKPFDLIDAVRRGRPVPPQLANQALVAITLAKRAPPPPPPLQLISNGDGFLHHSNPSRMRAREHTRSFLTPSRGRARRTRNLERDRPC